MSAVVLILDSDGRLRCPGCHGEFLHQRAIAVFSREEEDGPTDALVIGNMEASPQDNPSPRRDGFLISFECEQCHCAVDEAGEPVEVPPLFRLAILQHKGSTYVEWKSPT